jgi:GTP-binding protein HflX
MSDTVGFIRKLPTQLIESFKSTLDEVREADLLIHVVDISHSNFEEHVESVNKILEEIKSSDKPTIMVFNKIDNYDYVQKEEDDLTPKAQENYSLEELRDTWMAKDDQITCLFISAGKKNQLDGI